MRKFLAVGIIVVMAMLMVCVSFADSGVSVTGVSINAPDKSLEVGQGCQYTATVSPSNADNREVEWYTTDNKIVDVDDNGYVVGKRPGTCEIKVRTVDGRFIAKVTVTVTEKEVDVSAISIGRASYIVYVNDTYTVPYTIYPKNATDQKVSWTTSESSVATVSSGVVTAKAPGTTKITATTNDGSFSSSMTLSVRALPANPFKDTEKSSYRDMITILANRGVLKGTDGLFRPGDTITRGELAMVLKGALSLVRKDSWNRFTDVDSKAWYQDAVTTVVGQGMMGGYPDGSFRPGGSVTLEEAVAVVVRLFVSEYELSGRTPSGKSFNCSEWAKHYIDYAVSEGLVDTGKLSKFNTPATRDQIAYIVFNAMKKKGLLELQ